MLTAPVPIDPTLLDALLTARPCALFEDNLSPDGTARLFAGASESLAVRSTTDLADFFLRIEAAHAQGHWVVLAANYELGYALEPRLASLMPATDDVLARAWIWSDCVTLSRTQADALFDIVLARLAPPYLAPWQIGMDAQTHGVVVERVLEWITAGDCYQVNLTFPLEAPLQGDPLALYARLRTSQPVRYGGFLRFDDGAVLCRSPELFVARKGRCLTVKPMKGTAPLSKAAQLAASEKDRAENLMIVDLLRNDLGRLAPAGGVHVERLFEIEDYPTLHQMTSTIAAAPVDANLFDIFRALFPCGSVTGAPKILAMERIRALEAQPRGLYCGAFGWIAPGGDFSFCVPIRTAVVDRAGKLRLSIGSGIVADSDPAAEYAECLTKARFMTTPPAFALFETLRCEDGAAPYPLLERHLARLTRSAAALRFVFDAHAARSALLERAKQGTGARRVRLQLEPDGRINITSAPLDDLKAEVSVCLAEERLASGNPLLRHKTTLRDDYDVALKNAIAQGHFDVIYFNERDELCEGARSNVFVEIDGQLCTPPLTSGLLPGVMREDILARGLAQERTIRRDEFLAADRIYVANALRGLVQARVQT